MSIVVAFADTEEGAVAAAAGLREAVLRSIPLVVVPLTDTAADSSIIEDLRRDAATHDVEFEVSSAPQADKADHLLSVADGRDAQLIVIGLRRQTNVGKLILGSNAQRILLGSVCPVLTVKPSETVGE